MILFINTTNNDFLEIALKEGGKTVAQKKIKTHYDQAEKLLPAIEKMIKARKLELKNIKKIEVENRGGSFTSLRIGVVTANALNYALGGKIDIAVPVYDKEPNITMKKK